MSSKIKLPNILLGNLNKFSQKDIEEISAAYLFARKKHSGQKRRSGSPYILHPLRIAANLAKNKHDKTIIIAGLLHDTLEDTNSTFEELCDNFGSEVAQLVEGVTKISKIKIKDKIKFFSRSVNDLFLEQVDNYRKILLAASKDLRVILIKLYDRLDNISTIEFIQKDKQCFYARETIEIFAPIADRLGMGEIKGKLEDLAFPYAYPKEYSEFIKIAKPAYKNPQKVIQNVIPAVKRLLKENHVDFYSVSGRTKHFFSLYQKLKNKNDISLVFDIAALRIIVDTVENCYKTLGIIHSLYKPIPGRIYDYIARSKPSGYQSIHTTVQDNSKNVFEIQIRTQEMHNDAEFGSAAHWNYKDQQNKKGSKNQKEWLNELQKIDQIKNKKAFISRIKEEMFSKQIFTFTPKGDIIDLPAQSTPIDFAYRIHTDLGNHFAGIKINGRIMPANTKLQTGDILEIITSKKANPSKDWLNIAITANAKSKIRNSLRILQYDDFLVKGEKIILNEIKKNGLDPNINHSEIERRLSQSRLPYKSITDALVSLGEGCLSKSKLLKIYYPNFSREQKKTEKAVIDSPKIIKSLKGIRHIFASCCKPTPDSPNLGYLSKEHVIKIHRKNCKRIKTLDPKRLLELD